ncbi:Phytochrome-like protein cph2 [Clostridioides difficile]|nr:diguanylate cyclase [Clostridioides difficile]MCC0693662.1 GGDEF domain-containing protein [Clostridioides sp. ZZV14-6387]MCI9974868.1 GGDEF domain-containing protein [Clostridioides difficile]CZR97901.1 Phytochrome-like protein cph2 [Clostridioides difficile]CZS02238.1 Phytochrome-like protein cph2 [Clostridioides difficile]
MKGCSIEDLKRNIKKIEYDMLTKFYLNLTDLNYILDYHKELLNTKIEVKNRVYVLYLISLINYIKKDREASYKYLLDSLKDIKKLPSKENAEIISKIYIYLTLSAISIRKYDKANNFYFLAKKSIKQNHLNELLVLFNMSLCVEISALYKTKTDVISLVEEVSFFKNLKNKVLVSRANYIFGRVYLYLFNNFIKSMEYLIECLRLAQENNLYSIEAFCKCIISLCYLESGNNIEAIKYIKNVLDVAHNNNSISLTERVAIKIDLIWAYLKEDMNKEAEDVLVKAIKLMKAVEGVYKDYLYSFIFLYSAEIELKKSDYNFEKVNAYLILSKNIYKSFGDVFIYNSKLDYIYKLYGDLYIKFGNIDEGISCYLKGLNLVKKSSLNPKKMSIFYGLIANGYELKKDFKLAIEYYKSMDWYSDKWEKNNSYKTSQGIHKQYELRRKQESLKALVDNNKKLENDILKDGLTQLYNRRYLEEQLDSFNGTREKNMVAILVDIDYFKSYNDNYGHLAGDKVITKVTDIIRNVFIDITEHIIRYGGEEILILVDSIKSVDIEEIDNIELYIKRVFKLLEFEGIEHMYSKVKNYITISAGVSIKRCRSRKDAEVLIEDADKNLYKSKKAGRNQYIII